MATHTGKREPTGWDRRGWWRALGPIRPNVLHVHETRRPTRRQRMDLVVGRDPSVVGSAAVVAQDCRMGPKPVSLVVRVLPELSVRAHTLRVRHHV